MTSLRKAIENFGTERGFRTNRVQLIFKEELSENHIDVTGEFVDQGSTRILYWFPVSAEVYVIINGGDFNFRNYMQERQF